MEGTASKFKLRKSYMGFCEGTVGEAVLRGDRIVLLIKGNSHPINAELFKALQGDVYEVVNEPVTPIDPEPKVDPEDQKPVSPEEGKEEVAADSPKPE